MNHCYGKEEMATMTASKINLTLYTTRVGSLCVCMWCIHNTRATNNDIEVKTIESLQIILYKTNDNIFE